MVTIKDITTTVDRVITTMIVAIVVISSSLLLTGCRGNVVSSDFVSVDRTGWDKDSVVTLTYQVQDTTSAYQLLLYVRHTEQYPYQNMWLFLDSDTLEFFLADDRGQWLGNGKNGLIEMPVLLEDDIRIAGGEHTIHVQHGMRDDSLRGISDLGVVVKRH